jgi:hypothetical protein
VYHYISAVLKARKRNRLGAATPAAAEELVVDESLFDQDKSNDKI